MTPIQLAVLSDLIRLARQTEPTLMVDISENKLMVGFRCETAVGPRHAFGFAETFADAYAEAVAKREQKIAEGIVEKEVRAEVEARMSKAA